MILSKSKYLTVPIAALGGLLYKFRFKDGFQSLSELQEFQFRELRKTLLAARNAPYYNALFRDIHFDPSSDFKTIKDLERIPILEKSTIRKDFKHFVNPRYRGIAFPFATSGSTGEPMRMYLTWFMIAVDRGMIFRHYDWAAGTLRPKIFQLRSYVRPSPDAPLWRYSFADNAYCFSAYDLNSHTARFYIDELKKINPDIIRGYPASVFFLCDFLEPNDVLALTRLKAVITSSETLTSLERAKIESTFGKPVLNWYGMAEPAVIMKQDRSAKELKISMEYGYPEFLETDSSDIKRIVTTSYYNHIMPFIRYETGDLVQIDRTKTTQFGTAPHVLTVIGRKDEFLVGENGTRLPSINFYTMFRSYPKIKSFQIIQFSTLEVMVLYRSEGTLTPEELNGLEADLKMRLGKGIPVAIQKSEKFHSNPDGKTLVIVKKPGSLKLWNYDQYALSTQKAWSRFREGKATTKLDWNEADVLPSPGLLAHLQNVFRADPFVKWYPEAHHGRLLEKLGESLKVVDPRQIHLTHGSDSAIRLILQGFTHDNLCLAARPNYDNFRGQCEALGNRIEYVDMQTGEKKEMDVLIRKIMEASPRLIYLTNPNNPIGYLISNDELARVCETARKVNSLVMIDEAYAEFARQSAMGLLNRFDNCLILRTFSKAFGLAGLRLGYIVSSPENIEQIKKLSNPKDVTMLAVEAALYMLDHTDEVERYLAEIDRNKERFYQYCRAAQIEYFTSAANFVSYTVPDAEEYVQFMESKGVFVRDRRRDFGRDMVRATIGSRENFDLFLSADREFRQPAASATAGSTH